MTFETYGHWLVDILRQRHMAVGWDHHLQQFSSVKSDKRIISRNGPLLSIDELAKYTNVRLAGKRKKREYRPSVREAKNKLIPAGTWGM